jgi:hypothetical protein
VSDRSNDAVLDELRRLRVEVTALRIAHEQALSGPHRWMRYFVKDLETNPVTQYRVHLYGVIYWLINFPLVAALFFFAPNVWLKWGVFITLFYSIYSNFATDYGAMSAALAAEGQPALPEVPLEVTDGPALGGDT